MFLRSAFSILMCFFIATDICAEEIKVGKVILGRFKSEKKGIDILPKTAPYWPRIDRHNLAVDDSGQIYILNLLNRKIMVFNDEGKLFREIQTPIDPIRKKIDDYGSLEVSGDGKRLYINIPSQGKSYEPNYIDSRGLTLSEKGEILKQEGFPSIDVRLCDGNYVFLQGNYMYDKKFTKKKQRFTGFYDSEGMYRQDKNNFLVKTSRDGKVMWKKQYQGYFEIVGLDSQNNVYIHGVLRKGDADSLYKLNAQGEILALAPVPDPFPFKTQAEKDEWEIHASEEDLFFFKVACNGVVYMIFRLSELPEATFKRWLKGGEYFIYKFEMAGK